MPEVFRIRFIKTWGLYNKGEVAAFEEKEAKELCNPFNSQSDRIASWEDKDRENKVQEYIKARQAGEIKRDEAQSIRKKYYLDEYAYDNARLEEMAAEDEAQIPEGRSVKDYEATQNEGEKLLNELLHPIVADELHLDVIHLVIEGLNDEGVNPNLTDISDKLKEGDIQFTQKEITVSLTYMLENGEVILDPEQPKTKKHYIAKVKNDD